MLSRSSVPQYQSIGLDRAARLTGEAFGFDDPVSENHHAHAMGPASRVIWVLAAVAALSGLGYITTHWFGA